MKKRCGQKYTEFMITRIHWLQIHVLIFIIIWINNMHPKNVSVPVGWNERGIKMGKALGTYNISTREGRKQST